MQFGYVIHNNGRLYYEMGGAGEPVVFIHGFTLDRRMWQAQVDFFRNHGHTVITYDVRGFGKSSLPTYPYAHDDDLHALLEHLGVSKAHMIGLSMGGRIAINATLRYPAMVRTLALLDSALDGYDNEVDWDVHAADAGIVQAKENWMNHVLFTGTRKHPEVVAALRRIVADYTGWHWLHNDLQVPTSTDARSRLSEMRAPVLILVGENDLPYFRRISDVLAEGIPKAEKIVLPGVGHMINMEAPDECNRLLLEHVTRAAPSLL